MLGTFLDNFVSSKQCAKYQESMKKLFKISKVDKKLDVIMPNDKRQQSLSRRQYLQWIKHEYNKIIESAQQSMNYNSLTDHGNTNIRRVLCLFVPVYTRYTRNLCSLIPLKEEERNNTHTMCRDEAHLQPHLRGPYLRSHCSVSRNFSRVSFIKTIKRSIDRICGEGRVLLK